MSNTFGKTHPLFNAVEQAVFAAQCRNVGEVIRHLRYTTDQKSFNPAVIAELITAVATQYRAKSR